MKVVRRSTLYVWFYGWMDGWIRMILAWLGLAYFIGGVKLHDFSTYGCWCVLHCEDLSFKLRERVLDMQNLKVQCPCFNNMTFPIPICFDFSLLLPMIQYLSNIDLNSLQYSRQIRNAIYRPIFQS